MLFFPPMSLPNLVGMLPSEMEDLAVELGASRYRGRQLATWIYRKGVVELEAMTDLPKDFRSALAERVVVALPEVERETPSQDGSRKLVFRLEDGARVSSVVMPDDGRVTLCLSTQVGCGYACAFCLTGTMGLVRNLTAAEILGQVLRANAVKRAWSLEALMAAVRRYPLAPRQRVFFEYVLLDGVNDAPEDAQRLARLLRTVRAKVNLIPFNDWPASDFRRPPLARILAFQSILLDAGITTTVRWSKGEDIGAACGQLKEAVA